MQSANWDLFDISTAPLPTRCTSMALYFTQAETGKVEALVLRLTWLPKNNTLSWAAWHRRTVHNAENLPRSVHEYEGGRTDSFGDRSRHRGSRSWGGRSRRRRRNRGCKSRGWRRSCGHISHGRITRQPTSWGRRNRGHRSQGRNVPETNWTLIDFLDPNKK